MRNLVLMMVLVIFMGVNGCFMARDDDFESGYEVEMMTFNIRLGTANDGQNSWPNRKEQVFGVIKKYSPAVLGLQEAMNFQIKDILAELPEYDFVGVGRDDGRTRGEYCAILYRKDKLQVRDSGTFWLSETPNVPGSKSWNTACTRICTWAEFAYAATGQRFRVYNLHLDHISQQARLESIKLLLEQEKIADIAIPVVVMGDFNVGEDNEVVKLLKSRDGAVFMVDTFRVLYADAVDVGTFNRFSGYRQGDKIDYIFVRQADGVKVMEAEIIYDNKDGRWPSDHYPIRAKWIW